MAHSEKVRADVALFERGLAESREKARVLIMAGVVYRAEEKVTKPSEPIKPEDVLTVRGAPHPYVSRGGLKLEKALKCFDLDVQGVIAMDLGASTGGFTDVLLRNGARRVYAIDVGFGQLDWRLREDPRVTVMERTNARAITSDMFDEKPSLAVMDVSFISIRLILPAASQVLGEEGRIVTLIKPQFEAGRERVGKKGVVSDPATHRDVVREIRDFAPQFGWHAEKLNFSPITGPEGNIEFLMELLPGPGDKVTDEDIERIVREAHTAL